MFFILSVTHNKLLADVILATSFGSKIGLSSGHYSRIDKIETLPFEREFLNICVVSTYIPTCFQTESRRNSVPS